MYFPPSLSKDRNYFRFMPEQPLGTLQDIWEYSEFRLLFSSFSGAKRNGFIFSLCFCDYFINTGVLRQNNNNVKMDQPQ